MKTTLSDLGYADYSLWFIGHSGSTYWTKKDLEKAEIFRKIEPYLTFLNIPQLEGQSADIQTKVEELEMVNQSLRSRDKLKDIIESDGITRSDRAARMSLFRIELYKQKKLMVVLVITVDHALHG